MIKVHELMKSNVLTAPPHQHIFQIREIMKKHKIQSIPIVDPENTLVGIVSNQDLLEQASDHSPVSQHMTEKVYTIPEYEKVEIAARIMRNHKIHHLVVTKEKKVVGILSSFDLLKLVENHRFQVKHPAPQNKKGSGQRNRHEQSL